MKNKNQLRLLLLSLLILCFSLFYPLKKLEIKTNLHDSTLLKLEALTKDYQDLLKENEALHLKEKTVKDAFESLNKESELLVKEHQEKEIEVSKLKNRLKLHVNYLSQGINPRNYLALYTGNEESYEKEVAYYLGPAIDYSKEDAIKLLLTNLSSEYFSGLQLELVKIDEDNYAHVNLIENQSQKTPSISWQSNYFQGSTGGMVTSITLIESLLQAHLDNVPWIDGVVFSYMGEYNYLSDHVEYLFSEVHLR